MLRIQICGISICDVIELTTALKSQKQLLMPSISNLGGRESLEIDVNTTRLDIGIFYLLSRNITVRKHTTRSKYLYSYLRFY